ncbi:DUF192 domain-containing protein [Roseovarius amoyensis]|uniref:DUF192 domain-containing protein n=1 Tax=Roseovarius amoyensis TaxID=2211448 RepID=UPI001EF79562|nr:DUF192 domain-containing protein [Roseovarius amoyensis]
MVLVLGLGFGFTLGVGPALAEAACTDTTVQLRGAWGEARFTVEVADDDAERARGLMHRESLPRSAGMLFVYERPHRAGFWMKNTLIPLDILFADSAGVVKRVAPMAEPLSERLILGGNGIQYVLEINGGLAEAMGIIKGTELRHPAIGPDAAWPC